LFKTKEQRKENE